jgi:hypothetical protein
LYVSRNGELGKGDDGGRDTGKKKRDGTEKKRKAIETCG